MQDLAGQVFVVFIIAVAAAEAAVGLGIIMAFYRNKETVNIDEMTIMRWCGGHSTVDDDSMDLIWLIPILPGIGAARQRPDRYPLFQQEDRRLVASPSRWRAHWS